MTDFLKPTFFIEIKNDFLHREEQEKNHLYQNEQKIFIPGDFGESKPERTTQNRCLSKK
jgi:hypothetical protein